MTATSIPDDWWPPWLKDLGTEDPLASDPVVVAAIEETDDLLKHYRQLFTALVPVEQLNGILQSPGGIGFDVRTSGPHPVDSSGTWGYVPRFWIGASEAIPDGLEPLVVSWHSGNEFVLWPDPGFLMTYGLVPRLVTTGTAPILYWDDPEGPRTNVVLVRPVSSYDFPAYTGASVAIASDVLQDYSTIRRRALVQVYYLQGAGFPDDETRRLLGDQQIAQFRVKGRLLDLRLLLDKDDQRVLAQVWGVRPLLKPDGAPISTGRWDYGTLEWPGFEQPVTDDQASELRQDVAYVRDSVLAAYEGRPEFSIHPESGAVSHGNQWSVSWTERVGRDLIELQLKKLYEGTGPNTVRYWHDHSVPPPSAAVRAVTQNVGTRAKRITYALVALGEGLAVVASHLPSSRPATVDFVHLDRGQLDYEGWWTAKEVEPIARHIPLALNEDAFLDRCSTLHQLVGEGLSEGALRGLLQSLGIPPEDIEGFGSLKLLEHSIRLAELAKRTGLPPNNENLLNRLEDETEVTHIEKLFALYELRKLADHRADTSRAGKLRDALTQFGLDPAAYAGGWGAALDAIYDGVAETLEEATATLTQAASRVED